MTTLRRRELIATGAGAGAALAFGPAFWRAAYAAPARPGDNPYGALRPPDANGVMLPPGFTSRIVARSGQVVTGTTYQWHNFPDGAATFANADGGWTLVSNSEIPQLPLGGVGAIRFAADASIADAYRILDRTRNNCGGGPTPWGTWMSGEEVLFGLVYECDPTGAKPAVARPAMGTFAHEAVTVDPVRQVLYLTEDNPEGRFYRFTPRSYPDCSAGTLEAMAVDGGGRVSWVRVPDPAAAATARPAGTRVFDGGEGVWFDADFVYFTTKGTDQVFALDVVGQTLDVLYDAKVIGETAPLTGVDNCMVSRSGDLYVAEDGGDMELVLITPDRIVAPFLKLTGTGEDQSEITGIVFNPAGDRLYFSSQRGGAGSGPGFGTSYEVKGPFRLARPTVTLPSGDQVPATPGRPPVTTPPATPPGPGPGTGSGPSTGGPTPPAGGVRAARRYRATLTDARYFTPAGKLTPLGLAGIRKAARAAAARPGVAVRVLGYRDRVSDRRIYTRVAKRRVAVVVAALVRAGVPRSRIVATVPVARTQLKRPGTGTGRRYNRRTVITLG